MSLTDDTFALIPAPLIEKWGSTITYLASGTDTYNTSTGTIRTSDTTSTFKALITAVNPKEYDGLYQVQDLKVIIPASYLPSYYPTIRDRIQYSEAGTTREARIIDIKSYRGDNPIMHVLIVRPQ